MGTNYYWIVNGNPCKECGHNPVIEYHIGKSSAGWEFLFNEGYAEGHEPLGCRSFEEWGETFIHSEGYIINEYGDRLSVSEFYDVVENRGDKPLRNAVVEAERGGYYSSDRYWFDNEGYPFTTGEFS